MENNILKFSYNEKDSNFEDTVSSLKKYTEEFSDAYKVKIITSFDKKSAKLFDNFCGNLIYRELEIEKLDKTLDECRKMLKNGEEKEAAKKFLSKKSGILMLVENLKKLKNNTKIIEEFAKKKTTQQGKDGNKIFENFSKKIKSIFGSKLIENSSVAKYFYDNCLQIFVEMCEKDKIKTTLNSLQICEANIKKHIENKSNKNSKVDKSNKNVSFNFPKFMYKKQRLNIKLTPIINACEKYIDDWKSKYGKPSSDFNMHLIYDYLDFEGFEKSIEECKEMITNFKNKKSKSEKERTAFLKTIRDKLSSNGVFTEKMSLTIIFQKSAYLNNNAIGSFTNYYKNKNSKTESQFNGDYKNMIKSAHRKFSDKERDEFVEKHLGSFISIVSKLPGALNKDSNFLDCAEDINKIK